MPERRARLDDGTRQLTGARGLESDVEEAWARDVDGLILCSPRTDPRDALAAVGDTPLVVINGPRFSSRAESQWHAAAGWSVVVIDHRPFGIAIQ